MRSSVTTPAFSNVTRINASDAMPPIRTLPRQGKEESQQQRIAIGFVEGGECVARSRGLAAVPENCFR